MVDSALENHLKIRTGAGFAPLPDWTLLRISGPDAGTYLQTQLTSDVLALTPGSAQRSALTDRKGLLQAEFYLFRSAAEDYLCLIGRIQAETLRAHLERYHFIEALEIQPWPDLELTLLCGALSRLELQKLRPELPRALPACLPCAGGLLLQAPLTGDPGYILALPAEQSQSLRQQLETRQLPSLNPSLWHSLTLEAGLPVWGEELQTGILLPETGLEQSAVSYDKGCYLGQEVIARIRSYGVVPRALIGLRFAPHSSLPPAGQSIRIGEREVGQIRRIGYAPLRKATVALAYLHKQWRVPGEILCWSQDGYDYEAEVCLLNRDILPEPAALAREKLDQALACFAGTEEAQALPLLEEALLLDPGLKDGYEALGVILSRLGRQAEAIAVMQDLLQIDPEEPMAHTNLSRFFMLQGDRETAEYHMAEASRLNMEKQRSAEQQARQAEQQAAAQAAARAQMIAMFREVLESEDAEDLVANFGLGKIYADQQDYAQARPYLEKATQLDPLYSSAWLQLGKCLENLGDTAQAAEVYRQGMAAATRKGDLMPLKEMEQRLRALSQPA